jgi:hypothetical protein
MFPINRASLSDEAKEIDRLFLDRQALQQKIGGRQEQRNYFTRYEDSADLMYLDQLESWLANLRLPPWCVKP